MPDLLTPVSPANASTVSHQTHAPQVADGETRARSNAIASDALRQSPTTAPPSLVGRVSTPLNPTQLATRSLLHDA